VNGLSFFVIEHSGGYSEKSEFASFKVTLKNNSADHRSVNFSDPTQFYKESYYET